MILDIDGTLLDSNDAHANAWKSSLEKHGHIFSFEEVRRCIGMGADQLLPALVGIESDSEAGKAIIKERGRIFQHDSLADLKAFPEAKEMVEEFSNLGLKICVATSSNQKDLKSFLKIIGIESWIDIAVTSDEVSKSKPAPDLILAALEKSGLAAGECVMIGDTPYDIRAAKEAGVHTVAFRCGGWGDQSLSGASEIYGGPADLRKNLSHSLIFS